MEAQLPDYMQSLQPVACTACPTSWIAEEEDGRRGHQVAGEWWGCEDKGGEKEARRGSESSDKGREEATFSVLLFSQDAQ